MNHFDFESHFIFESHFLTICVKDIRTKNNYISISANMEYVLSTTKVSENLMRLWLNIRPVNIEYFCYFCKCCFCLYSVVIHEISDALYNMNKYNFINFVLGMKKKSTISMFGGGALDVGLCFNKSSNIKPW